MSDEPISNLPVITTPASGDLFALVQSGVTGQLDYDDLTTALNGLFLPLAGGTMTGDIQLGNNKLNFTDSTASIFSEDTDGAIVIQGGGFLFDALDTLHKTTYRSPNTGTGPIHLFDYQASNSIGETDTDYAGTFIFVHDATNGSESGYYEFVAKQGGSTQSIMGLNIKQNQEVFIENNIQIQNLGTAELDPTLSSNSTINELTVTTKRVLHTTSETTWEKISKSAANTAFDILGYDQIFGANDGAGVDVPYGGFRSFITDATAGSESAKIQFLVRNNGVTASALTLNEKGTGEVFVFNSLEFHNDSGDDPILSSVNTARVLHLQGSYTISSKLYLTDETHSISKDSDDLAFEAPEFFNFVSANDSNHLKLFGQGNAINDVPALISFIGRNLADTANKTWGLIDVKILDTGTPGDSTMTFSLTNKQPLKLNPNERGEVFIDTNVEWENNANNDQLILTTDSDDDLTFEGGKVVVGATTQKIYKTGAEQTTTNSSTDVLVTNLALTLPNRPGRLAKIIFSPSLKVLSPGKRVVQFVLNESTAQATGTVTCASVIVGNTLTVNGLVYTAVSGVKADNTEFSVDTGDDETATDLADSITADIRIGTDESLVDQTAIAASDIVTIIATSGSLGNNVGLSSTGGTMTVSGATLTGGASPPNEDTRMTQFAGRDDTPTNVEWFAVLPMNGQVITASVVSDGITTLGDAVVAGNNVEIQGDDNSDIKTFLMSLEL